MRARSWRAPVARARGLFSVRQSVAAALSRRRPDLVSRGSAPVSGDFFIVLGARASARPRLAARGRRRRRGAGGGAELDGRGSATSAATAACLAGGSSLHWTSNGALDRRGDAAGTRLSSGVDFWAPVVPIDAARRLEPVIRGARRHRSPCARAPPADAARTEMHVATSRVPKPSHGRRSARCRPPLRTRSSGTLGPRFSCSLRQPSLLLLITCINVANLLLVRGLGARAGDRRALGARCRARADRAATAHRERAAGAGWRRSLGSASRSRRFAGSWPSRRRDRRGSTRST